MTWPDNIPPKTPQQHDGVDSSSSVDLQFVEDNLSAIQPVVGTRGSDRLIAVGEMMKGHCRVATGNMFGTFLKSGTDTVTINGHTWTYDHTGGGVVYYNEDYFFRGYREYFTTDKSDSLFTRPPIVYYTCNKPLSGSLSASWIKSVSTSYVDRKCFQPFGKPSHVSGAVDVYYDISWLAIEPINDVVDMTDEYININNL